MNRRPSPGFTLLEVLVALAIFATVAASVLSAASRGVVIAEQLEQKTLASWIADNRISELQIKKVTPGDSREDKLLEYGGRAWETHSEIEATSDKGLRRVTVWVAPKPERGAAAPVKERSVFSLTGFLVVRR